MREMTTSKTPWISEYPADWDQVPLHARNHFDRRLDVDPYRACFRHDLHDLSVCSRNSFCSTHSPCPSFCFRMAIPACAESFGTVMSRHPSS